MQGSLSRSLVLRPKGVILVINTERPSRFEPRIVTVTMSGSGSGSVIGSASGTMGDTNATNICYKLKVVWLCIHADYSTFMKPWLIPQAVTQQRSKLTCDGRESNPGQLLGRQLCSPLYHHRCQVLFFALVQVTSWFLRGSRFSHGPSLAW